MSYSSLRRLLPALVAGILVLGGCMKHEVTQSADRAKPKQTATRTSAEEDTFEILQGDWMRQHERPYTPPAQFSRGQ
jgi:hypothetical protein